MAGSQDSGHLGPQVGGWGWGKKTASIGQSAIHITRGEPRFPAQAVFMKRSGGRLLQTGHQDGRESRSCPLQLLIGSPTISQPAHL